MQSKKIIRYDILRIAMMMLVILYHYTTRYDEVIGHKDRLIGVGSEFATFSVSVFLIMLGYFSYNSIENGKSNVVTYLKKRLVRLLPSYWVALTFTTIVVNVIGNGNVSIKQYVANFIFVNRFIGEPFVDGAYWYMTIVIVYTFFSSIYVMLSEKKREFLCALYASVYCILGVVQLGFSIVPNTIALLFFQYVNKCLWGFFLAKLHEKRTIENKVYVYLLVFSIGDILWVDLKMFICDILASIVFFVVERMKGNCKKVKNRAVEKIIMFFSSSSYFIYLVHQQIGFVIIQKLEHKGLSSVVSILIAMLLVFFVAYVYSLVGKFVRQRMEEHKIVLRS